MICPKCSEPNFEEETGCTLCGFVTKQIKQAKKKEAESVPKVYCKQFGFVTKQIKQAKKKEAESVPKVYCKQCDSPYDIYGVHAQCWNMCSGQKRWEEGEKWFCHIHRAEPSRVYPETTTRNLPGHGSVQQMVMALKQAKGYMEKSHPEETSKRGP